MDWSTYKKLCDQPDYWSWWMIEQSAELLQDLEVHHVARRLRSTQKLEPLPTPEGFTGSAAHHMYQLQLTRDEAVAGLAGIKLACARGLSTAATRQRGLAGFVAAWEEYCRSLGAVTEPTA